MQRAGISIIYQEFNLLPYRTVADNIFLGREPTRYGLIDRATMRAQTVALLKRLDAASIISPDALVADLSVAQQQIAEIAKAPARRAHPGHGRADRRAVVERS